MNSRPEAEQMPARTAGSRQKDDVVDADYEVVDDDDNK